MAVFTTAFVAGALGVASTSLAATVSAFALNAAVGIGVSMLAQQLQKSGSASQQANGVNGSLQAGGDVARSFVMGRRATAGSLVYANTWGQASKTPNAYFTQVIALSDMPIRTISAFWVNGDPVTVDTSDTSYGDWGYPVTEFNTGNNNHMWIKFYDGTQTVADPFLVNTVSSADRPYQNTRVGTGIAYAVVTSQANDELFTGFPTFRFEVQGAPLYDITKDSSAGGNGAQRWANPATWGGDGDDLTVVQIYNILRGITYAGDWLYGLQSLTAPRLPAADWITQVNKCRAAIAGPSGPEATYLTGIEVSIDTEISETTQSLLTGSQGKLIETGGFYKVRVGEPGASVYAFSDGDILSTEEQSFTPFFGLADTVNGVSATYPEPNEAWNTKTAPPLYNATFEAQDGNRRLMTSVDLNMVYRSSQVQRIMLSALNEARRARRHTFVLPPQAWVLEPGDIISFTSNRNGYVAKLFRVDGIADHANLDVTLDLTEVDPSDYDWDQEHDYKPPVFAPLGPVMPPAQPMYGWQVEPATINDSSGVPWRPSIKVSCAPDQTDISNVWVQVRLAATEEIVFDSDSTRYGSPYSWVLNANFKGSTDYEARGRFIPSGTRVTNWSDWLPVTTPNVVVTDLIVDLQHVKNDILDRFKGLQKELLDVRPLVEQLLINTQFSDAVLNEAQRSLVASVGQSNATFTENIQVVADAANAAASQVVTLTATVANNKAQADTQIAVVTGVANAAAAQATTLSVTVDDLSAQGLVKFSVAADQTGVNARFSIALRTSVGASYVESGMFLEIYTVGGVQKSRFSVMADQFSVLNPDSIGTSYLPLVFQGGVLKLQNVKVEWADIVNAVITWAQIQTAVVNNFVATTANIGSLVVGTSNLGYDQITSSAANTRTGTTPAGGESVVGTTWVINNPNPTVVLTSFFFQFTVQGAGSGGSTIRVRLVNDTTGQEIAGLTITVPSSGSSSTQSVQSMIIEDRPGAQGNYQYSIRGQAGAQNITATIRQLWWKR
ncbi:DUF1983 domain-containing protein [Agrobacterium rhizogenes]|nr:DUF1983 domain-containing protein [Rhizobium rhizogenes]